MVKLYSETDGYRCTPFHRRGIQKVRCIEGYHATHIVDRASEVLLRAADAGWCLVS